MANFSAVKLFAVGSATLLQRSTPSCNAASRLQQATTQIGTKLFEKPGAAAANCSFIPDTSAFFGQAESGFSEIFERFTSFSDNLCFSSSPSPQDQGAALNEARIKWKAHAEPLIIQMKQKKAPYLNPTDEQKKRLGQESYRRSIRNGQFLTKLKTQIESYRAQLTSGHFESGMTRAEVRVKLSKCQKSLRKYNEKQKNQVCKPAQMFIQHKSSQLSCVPEELDEQSVCSANSRESSVFDGLSVELSSQSPLVINVPIGQNSTPIQEIVLSKPPIVIAARARPLTQEVYKASLVFTEIQPKSLNGVDQFETLFKAISSSSICSSETFRLLEKSELRSDQLPRAKKRFGLIGKTRCAWAQLKNYLRQDRYQKLVS